MPQANSTDLVQHVFKGELISQRAADGYIKATALCKSEGKRWPDYARLDATKAFIEALSGSVHIPTDLLIHAHGHRGPRVCRHAHPEIVFSKEKP